MLAINLWSGPRNVSTALMYSFGQRPDTKVVDEPLYGHFLRVTGTIHPGRDEVMAAVNCDGNAVMRELLQPGDDDRDVLFMKQMAHHFVDLEDDFLHDTKNIFLVRDPHQMLPSLTIQLPNASLADTGLKLQWQLFERLTEMGQYPAIVDSKALLLDPPGILYSLCAHLGITYTDSMLSWPAGARAEDGIWAPYWYHAVHESSGFSPYAEKTGFPDHLLELLSECQPWYAKLVEHAITASGH